MGQKRESPGPAVRQNRGSVIVALKTTLAEWLMDRLSDVGVPVATVDDIDIAHGTVPPRETLAERVAIVARKVTVVLRTRQVRSDLVRPAELPFEPGAQYINRYSGRRHLACDCGWSRSDPEERRRYVVLFEVDTGLRYNPDNINPADWRRVE